MTHEETQNAEGFQVFAVAVWEESQIFETQSFWQRIPKDAIPEDQNQEVELAPRLVTCEIHNVYIYIP